MKIGEALLFSPLFGFLLSALLLLAMKAVIKAPELYKAPTTNAPPTLWVRGLLVLTCTLVSFFHGSNDGQKGMGLIMLILIGVAPTAYALNRAPPAGHADAFIAAAQNAAKVVEAHGAGYSVIGDPRPAVTQYIHAHQISEGTYPSLAVLVKQISDSVKQYGSVARTPLEKVQNVRNDMYLASEAMRVLAKDKESELSAAEKKADRRVQETARLFHQIHPALGQDLRRHRARARHDGRLEAHRHHRRREDRQDPPDLRPGRGGGDHRGRDDRGGRRLRPAGLDHACALVRRRRHDGGERLGNAMVDGAQHRHGLGPDPARGDDPVRAAVLHLPPRVLTWIQFQVAAPGTSAPGIPSPACGRRWPRAARPDEGTPDRPNPITLQAPQPPPYQVIGRARCRGMRMSRAFRSASVRYIIAVIRASE